MKVLVTVVPLAGHVGPVSGLVAELVSRGHQVRVYTGSRYRQRFTDLGATVVTWSAAREFDEDDLGATIPHRETFRAASGDHRWSGMASSAPLPARCATSATSWSGSRRTSWSPTR